jgi:hypothetical protein
VAPKSDLKKDTSGIVLDYSRNDVDDQKYLYDKCPKSLGIDYQVKLNLSVSEFYNNKPVIRNQNKDLDLGQKLEQYKDEENSI